MATIQETRPSVNSQQHRPSFRVRNSQQLMYELAVQQKQEELEEEHKNFKNILKRIYEKESEHHDSIDVSLQPSFSKFQLPYFIKCRNRYNASKKIYEQRFQYEIQQLIAQQATGYEAARLNSRSEITHTQRYFFSLTRKERQRLYWIMSTKII